MSIPVDGEMSVTPVDEESMIKISDTKQKPKVEFAALELLIIAEIQVHMTLGKIFKGLYVKWFKTWVMSKCDWNMCEDLTSKQDWQLFWYISSRFINKYSKCWLSTGRCVTDTRNTDWWQRVDPYMSFLYGFGFSTLRVSWSVPVASGLAY